MELTSLDAPKLKADVSEMMIKETYRKRILIIGVILAVVIPVGGMLATFACTAWPVASGSATQESIAETIRFAEKFHWVKQTSGIIGSILLVGLYIDYSQRKKKELR